MDEPYIDREQSEAKHLMLRTYLERLAYKVGFYRKRFTLNYVDGFAGPWQSKSEDLSDTSPAIALKQLLEVRDGLLTKGGNTIDVRAFFVSLTEGGAAQLRDLKARFPGAEITVVENTFEGALEDARAFARTGWEPFSFIFIDPTGWTGFGLKEIAPLLLEGDNEVLINFMTKDIVRFIGSNDGSYEPTFRALFGDDSASYREEWRGLTGLDREDRIVATYCERVALAGNYKHCASSVVLNPRVDRTHFHLVYGTRSDEGLVTFREEERKALKFQREGRAVVQQRDLESRSGQGFLFPAPALVTRTYEDELRERYCTRANRVLDAMLSNAVIVPWNELVLTALRIPMISEADVKDWFKVRERSETVEVLGLAPGKRVPQRNQGHRVRRLK